MSEAERTISSAAADQLHAEALAARIIAVRLWGYLALLQSDPKDYLNKQMTQCLQSVDITKIEGRDPGPIKQMAKTLIQSAFASIIVGPTSATRSH
jgi:hypothetical protein